MMSKPYYISSIKDLCQQLHSKPYPVKRMHTTLGIQLFWKTYCFQSSVLCLSDYGDQFSILMETEEQIVGCV